MSEAGRRWGRVGIACTVLACWGAVWMPRPASAQVTPARQAEYCRALRAYVNRDFPVAVSIGRTWSIDELKPLLHSTGECKDDSIALEAAIVFQTDLAAHLGGTIELVANRLQIVESVVEHLPKGRSTRFQEEWYVAASSLMLAWTSPEGGSTLADRGLRRVSGSPRLRMLIGVAEEMRQHGRDGNLHDRPTITAMARSLPRAALSFAESMYRRALEADPDLHEARVHLGRVMFLQRNLAGARAALLPVVSNTRPPLRMRYLAHLFLGAIEEFEGDREAARGRYDEALALGPEFQTAYVALSFVEAALGHQARARDLMTQYAALPADEVVDPWWDYQNGGVQAGAFEWLHAQVLK